MLDERLFTHHVLTLKSFQTFIISFFSGTQKKILSTMIHIWTFIV